MTKAPKGVSGDDLASILESLDRIQQEANGIGALMECIVTIDLTDGRVTALWVNGEWRFNWYGKTS